MMDSNVIREWMTAFLQQEQKYILGLTLICSIIVAGVMVLSVFVGVVVQKRYVEIVAEIRKLRESIKLESQKLADVKKTYSSIKNDLYAATQSPELLQERELLDSVIKRLDDKDIVVQLSPDTFDQIISAMSFVSVTNELEDIKRLLKIFDLARGRAIERLEENAFLSLRRTLKS